MLKELKMELSEHEVNYRQASRMQGVLMEKIDTMYAEKMHEQGLKPYNQTVIHEDDRVYWIVRTLNDEADKEILSPLKDPGFSSFKLKNALGEIKIIKKEEREKSFKTLMKDFYSGMENQRYINITFQTPTAFKSNNRYIFYPEPRNLYFSLMNKYSAAAEEINMLDEDLLEQLAENSTIVSYNLQSVAFPLEGIKIPSFVGQISIKVNGSQTLASYAHMLFEFGEYSGVGIKTAIGMGSIRLNERREK